MKTIKPLLFASVLFIAVSCSKSTSSTNTGNWVNRSEFNGVVRTEASSFVINDTAYIATGYDGTNRLSDMWSFSPAGTIGIWTQRAQFPGTPRNSAVGFAAAGKGYITTGYDGLNMLGDNWQYDPVANSWTQKANFGGNPRYDAVAFGLMDKGYVGTGFDNNYDKDFWMYDPTSDSWTQNLGFGGNKRSQAVTFVHNNIAYLATGINNGTLQYDFWSFNPATTGWTQLRSTANISTDTYDDNYGTIDRSNAAAIVIGDSAYITTGAQPGLTSTTWGYNFATDLWFTMQAYEGAPRTGATGFSISAGGYVGLGISSTLPYDDFRQFFPDEAYNAND
jgi:N-acetylneuraminic acid mutarotase